MEKEIAEYANELKKIVEISKTHRLGYIPDVYKTLLIENIKYDLTDKSNNLVSDLNKKDTNDLYSAIDGWKSNTLLNILSSTVEFLTNFFNNYKDYINRSTYSSYTEKQNKISHQEDAISKYVNKLSSYIDIFSCENEGKDLSNTFLTKLVLFVTSSKAFYEAKRITDDTIIGRLTLLLSSTQTLEVLAQINVLQNDSEKILFQIRDLHNLFKGFYFEYEKILLGLEDQNNVNKLENIKNELIEIKKDKIYYLNILSMSLNYIQSNYFKEVLKDTLEVYKSQDLLPDKLKSSDAISKILNYFQDKRVDTIKEAINLYFTETKQDEQYNKLVVEMQGKINSLEGELLQTKNEFKNKNDLMQQEYERLLDAHNSLVDKHNDLVDDHNDLVDKHNEVISVAKEIKDALD